MSKRKPRIDTGGGDALSADNPFGTLSVGELPDGPAPPPPAVESESRADRRRAKRQGPKPRLDVRRLKSGKGGKTVTEISGFVGVSDAQLQDLAKQLKRTCGVGGTVRERVVEIQGDQREKLASLLEERGYRVVLAGG